MFWRLFMLLMGAGGIGCLAYLVTRFHRFNCLQRLAGRRAWCAWLLAAVPVALICCFGFINVTALAVVLLHLALIWALCDAVGLLARRLLRRDRPRRYWAGIAALAVTIVYLGCGWYFAHHVFETRYAFETGKPLDGGSLRIVEIADAHLGITQDGESFARLMERVQAAEPDAVVIVGDFVDDDTPRGDMERACAALGELETTYGVYFAYGNHDNGYFGYRDFSAAALREALEESGVTILEDEAASLGAGAVLIGRRDRSAPGRASAQALMEGLDDAAYVVMLDHQPNDYDAEAAAGADLVLSGHTHGGHIFPAGYIGLWMGANDRVYGAERRGDTTFVVTSGVSGWAIPFKTGAISEYVVIDVTSSPNP